MRSDVGLKTMAELLDARIFLRLCQRWLWIARATGQPGYITIVLEREVCWALDRLWEAQQRAA
jgi:hypothetical protein